MDTANPAAVILYKPHPDVEAGLRPGAIRASDLADHTLADTDPSALLAQVHEVWTMTSLLGFEALIRGIPVTCLGVPFYAGWGLTCDLGPVPERRSSRRSLDELVAARTAFDPAVMPVCPENESANGLKMSRFPANAPISASTPHINRTVPSPFHK